MSLPTLAYQADVAPASRLVLCRLWDYARPTEVRGVCAAYIYKLQLQNDLRMNPGTLSRALRELLGSPWLISFSQADGTGVFVFELYTGEGDCSNG